MNGPELAAHVGATYRQISYWTQCGWLVPDAPNPGSGTPLSYGPEQVWHARAMTRLVGAGVAPGAAHMLATALAALNSVDLGDGMTLTMTET